MRGCAARSSRRVLYTVPMHAIEARQLTKRFGTLTAVNGVSFTVERGEVLGFLGPNGAGKSTTMKMITGFLEPSGGYAKVYGHDVMEAPIEAKRKIGYLPEGAPLYGEMTPQGFLEFIAEVRGLRGAAAEARIAEAVEKIHLEGVMRQRIETLSKGYKRRVGLAQALLHDPEVLILDEPTDGLDPNQKHEVRALIKDMAAQKSIIISTHILEEVDAVCTRAIIIGRGRVLFSGTPAELAARSEYHNAVALIVKAGVAAAAKKRIEALAGVLRVEEGAAMDGHSRLLAVPRNGASLVAQVAELARAGGWEIDGLEVESGRLDEVFRTITAQYKDDYRDDAGRRAEGA